MRILILVVVLVALTEYRCNAAEDSIASKPLFRDPIYNGAADPVVIWNPHTQKWWMFYTNRRANVAGLSGVAWAHGTHIGIAESSDGAQWNYVGTADINIPKEIGGDEPTQWAPEVLTDASGLHHMFLTVVPGVFENWEHPRTIVHLTSSDLRSWNHAQALRLSSDRVIDPAVHRLPTGGWRLWYNNERDHKSIYYADSPDLITWTDRGKCTGVGERPGEGPYVFRWHDSYWMLVDIWQGLGVYRSDDLLHWRAQPGNLVDKPGRGVDDGVNGGHPCVVVNGGRAYCIYFTHPGRAGTITPDDQDSPELRRSSIQIVELHLRNGQLECDRDQPVHIHLTPPLAEGNAAFDPVPGTVVDYSPASSGRYIGSPSIAILPDGGYVASHDFFGPKSNELISGRTVILRSHDRGASWQGATELEGTYWSTLFVHKAALYLIGVTKQYGKAMIRRSLDGGLHWSSPDTPQTGLLLADGEYHCAPMPVIEHGGRVWRALEQRNPPSGWGTTFRAGMLSAPANADLLNSANWTASNFLPSERDWNHGDMGGWLEGNAVVAPSGNIVDVLRVDTKSADEKVAVVIISDDGRRASFDPATGFCPFPGGAKKFAIRLDPQTHRYWSLASVIPKPQHGSTPGAVRNMLALVSSPDLRTWTEDCILLFHPDEKKHGFQYVDWQFDGDDIIAACRTSYDDGLGGAHSYHDANFLTFHRWTNFRHLTMADSTPAFADQRE